MSSAIALCVVIRLGSARLSRCDTVKARLRYALGQSMTKPLDQPLNLFFPQWQGSGRPGLYEGAQMLCDALSGQIPLTKIPTSTTYSLAVQENILGYSQLTAQLIEVCSVIEAHNPQRILTIGGDCGVEIAPVSFLNKKYDQSLAVIWLDAHGDLNTPSSSPSAHFHGMPLRVLLGEGDPMMVNQAFSTLRSDQVFLVGAREFDLAEKRFIRQQKLSVISAKTVNEGNIDSLILSLKEAGFNQVYIHLDLDVIEPIEFPHVACPTPNGIFIDRLKRLLKGLKSNFNIVGLSVLEFLPNHPKQDAILDLISFLNSTQLLSLTALH